MVMFLFKMLLAFLAGGTITTFLGYLVHWVFHQPWSHWFYNAHMNHHKIQYPPTSFFSEKYKSAGRDSTSILFVIAFAPAVFAISMMMMFGILSMMMGAITLVSLGVFGIIHDYVHDQFHINNSRWKNNELFLKWRKLHYIHHLDMRLNFGIVFFAWDKLFNTYDDADDVDLHE